jgi:hypothetical protein
MLAIGLANSITFPIFTLASGGSGRRAHEGSGIICIAIVGAPSHLRQYGVRGRMTVAIADFDRIGITAETGHSTYQSVRV